MGKDVVVTKLSGKAIPEGYLKPMLELYNSSVGAAYCEKGKKIVFIHSLEGGTDFETMDGLQKDCKGDIVLFHFGNSQRTSELDCSPYILLSDKDKNPIAVAMVEGDFSGNEKKGSSYTGQYFAVNEVIIPKLQTLYDLCDGDIKDTISKFNSDKIRASITNTIVGDGSITVLFNNGQMLMFDKNTKKKAFDWGWTTDPMEYGAAAAAPEAKTEKFGLSKLKDKLMGKSAEKTEEPVTPPASEPAHKIDDDDDVPRTTPAHKIEDDDDAPKTAPVHRIDDDDAPAEPAPITNKGSAIVADTSTKSELIQKVTLTEKDLYYEPPADMLNRKHIKRAYRTNAGFLPNNWEDKPRVKIAEKKQKALLVDKKKQTLRSLQDLGSAIKQDEATTAVKHAAPVDLQEDDTPVTTKHVESTHIPQADRILSAIEKKNLDDFLTSGMVRKVIDKHSKIAFDPENLQKTESKIANFTELTNIEPEETIGFPDEILLALINSHQKAALTLIRSLHGLIVPIVNANKRKAAAEEAEEAEPPKKVAAGGVHRIDDYM